MITKIEIKNFQSHKNTVIEFDKGINSLCGESDNGKTAIIRAIKWLVENRPLGVDKLNSNWNKDFKEPMSVRLYTESGWVERIRSKDRNGYTICHNNSNPIELSAVGTDVPSDVIEFLRLTDVNFQYQLDSPYLISMTPGEASKYLNNIVHLDSIDKLLSTADSNKREILSEQKIVDSDIDSLKRAIKDTEWIDKAVQIKNRIEKYDEIISSKKNDMNSLNDEINNYESITVVDLSKQEELIKNIENIEIPDSSELENEINQYEESLKNKIDLTKQIKLIVKIEEIEVEDSSELENEINQYVALNEEILKLNKVMNELLSKMPKVCPLCGGELKEGETLCL